ncbi:flagellin [Cereibacter ovatus]|uniref:Flagellin n=1 Tax=Cereibacter ovatus TaxID=439529 RepID=A0A285D3E7_9RHOB|nr:flagellin [Cereibacter ovatus]SNX74302.1 flagellin [Cereibacter ovatus]
MSSILTNSSAMVALQTLKTINTGLSKTQNEISTGKSIASAKDNAAIWSIAKVMDTDASSFKVIGDQLSVAESTLAVGVAGAEQIVGLLKDMKDLAAGAANDTADFDKVQDAIKAKSDQITAIIDGSQLNGIALLKTDIGNGGATYDVLASLDRTSGTVATTAVSITVTGPDFEANVDAAGVTAVADKASALTAVGEIEALIDTAIEGAATLGAAASRVTDQKEFVGKLVDSLKNGISSMVDADMEAASAKLQALQVQQQLATQSLSIANQAPQNILSLFR